MPDWLAAVNILARTLAVYKDADFYNPAEAVAFAKRACEMTNYSHPEVLDTLAIAYASNNQFTEAIETTQKALNLINPAKQPQFFSEIESRLQLYKASKSYSKPLPAIR